MLKSVHVLRVKVLFFIMVWGQTVENWNRCGNSEKYAKFVKIPPIPRLIYNDRSLTNYRNRLSQYFEEKDETAITGIHISLRCCKLHNKALSPTGSALARTDLSPLTNGIWEIHAGCSCFLHLQLLAKIG